MVTDLSPFHGGAPGPELDTFCPELDRSVTGPLRAKKRRHGPVTPLPPRRVKFADSTVRILTVPSAFPKKYCDGSDTILPAPRGSSRRTGPVTSLLGALAAGDGVNPDSFGQMSEGHARGRDNCPTPCFNPVWLNERAQPKSLWNQRSAEHHGARSSRTHPALALSAQKNKHACHRHR